MSIQAIREFHIGEGGLLRRFERAAHLTSLPKQIALALSITWLPVVLLSLVNEQLTGRREPLIDVPSLHVRLLVAMPVFLALDHVFPRVCRHVLKQLVSQSFVPDAAEARLDRLLRSATSLADSMVPEVLLGLLALTLGVGELAGVVRLTGVPRYAGLTAAHVWYTLADVPFLQFLLWRSLWRWIIWVRVLIGLSRIDLDLVPSHPDRLGGISFLRLPSIGYCGMLLFAISSMVCADHVRRFTSGGVTLAGFMPLLLIFGAVGALLAFGPLLLFSPQLARARLIGAAEYGRLGSEYGRRFQRRWCVVSSPAARIGPRSTQPLADLATIYRDTVNRLRPVMVGKRDVITLLIATLLPMVPVILMRVPNEDWRQLLEMLTGGPLG